MYIKTHTQHIPIDIQLTLSQKSFFVFLILFSIIILKFNKQYIRALCNLNYTIQIHP